MTPEPQVKTAIDTYFHVVAASKSEIDGYLPRARIDAQLKVMNEAYKKHDFSFNLKGVKWTINSMWADNRDSTREREMKKNLRQGTYQTLNIYFVKKLENKGDLGDCYFPEKVTPAQLIKDGCRIVSSAVSGDTGAVKSSADFALGLFHTFENGCTSPGDEIEDTSYQKEPTQGCPSSPPPSKCPQGGNDPIHNYMDYSHE
ncbi:predicted protein [Uncinocarpus reesii 1704]|uniref:Uncharacterized protein n=1 Tax=Uncinocarpus reesii (strain UAMH 1704) TaxID=336963 RepID=C4JEX3_UNCRE|nr:uncharacterized protein UREG_00873 [Uncinocarpus reesii 1704]EEP76026.1 predicted protein [Uncinocarpus reesii 1704]